MFAESTVARRRRCHLAAWIAIMCGASGCSKSLSPAAPSASVGTPTPMAPANGAQIANLAQPVSLTIQNATVSSGVSVTYTFEIATDAAFANKVQTKTTPAGDGQTTVKLDTLLAAKDYYWHAQASTNGAAASFGPVASFSIGPVASVGSPVGVSPVNGASATGQVQLIVANATKAGPTGAIQYRFDVADNLNFNPIAFSTAVPEGGNQTSVTIPAGTLATGKTFYWRATVIDITNNITGLPSTTLSFSTVNPSAASLIAAQQGVTLWPGAQPPAFTTSQARMGVGWDVATRRDYLGNTFLSPLLESLQIFDLLDRGMDPDSAIAWMHSHGYGTTAVYYASVQAIGFQPQYMALIGGSWELVLRVGA